MSEKKPAGAAKVSTATPPWMKLTEPTSRTLRVYALDPSAGNFVGNVMSVKIRWERNLKPGPIGRRFAVIDYDGANKRYYPPVDLNDYRILAQDGLDPSESDPRFHQQMVYAVASRTVEKFETALGRTIHWRRAERPGGERKAKDPADDIWVLKLYPHAMVQANAFYCRQAHGILFGYFRASMDKPGKNLLPGQTVFTCLSHDIIAHEVTHAVIDGIRKYFTEPTNPDVLAFHEAFADLTALFLHFSHKEALLDTIRKTGGRLYTFELTPDAAPVKGSARAAGDERPDSSVSAEAPVANPLVQLAQQFGRASGKGEGLRQALDWKPDPALLQTRIHDPHFRGSILVAAVFDAYFSTYLRASADLFNIYGAGGGQMGQEELPVSLANLLAANAARIADDFFMLCARAIDYCPPVDVTFGDFLRALITVSIDLKPDDEQRMRQALMQAFRVRGIFPDDASFFSEDALAWPRVPRWTRPAEPDALPPVTVKYLPESRERGEFELVFGDPGGLSAQQKDLNGEILRAWAWENAARLGFDSSRSLKKEQRPFAPSFHQVFRVGPDGRTRSDMVVELVQTRRVPFDQAYPKAGTFPVRGGVTLIISAPGRDSTGHRTKPVVRYAIGKKLVGSEGKLREERQRQHAFALGLHNGDTTDDAHFQADFGLIHQGT